jgi:hypothetical protein
VTDLSSRVKTKAAKSKRYRPSSGLSGLSGSLQTQDSLENKPHAKNSCHTSFAHLNIIAISYASIIEDWALHSSRDRRR